MYWQAVLKEVLNRNSEEPFLFTNLRPEGGFIRKKNGEFDNQKIYKLGGEYGDLYLTQREVDCIVRIIQGKTIVKIATELALSPRTVEFYLRNVKSKLRCRTKAQLIEKIMQNNLLAAVRKSNE